MTRALWGFAFILAAPALLLALPYAWLLVYPFFDPPNCQDGPCPWPADGPKPFLAREDVTIPLWIGTPSLTALVGLGPSTHRVGAPSAV